LRHVSREFKDRYGEPAREYHKLAFDKAIARSKEAVFIAPGHPLLEAMIEQLLKKGAEPLRRGALFFDPDGRLDGWLWFFEGEIRDGANRIAGQRLFAVFQPRAGEPHVVNPSILWDLQPASGADWDGPPPPESESKVIAVVFRELERYRELLRDERRRVSEIKRKYGLRSLEKLILDSEARLTEYETRVAKGEPLPDAEIQNERRRKEELEARKRGLEKEIQQEESLTLTMPTVLGVARVRPLAGVEPSMRPDVEIEAIGMRVAMEYERRQGRMPEDVSAQNLGFDIRSVAADGSVRYIEVKARATTGPIVLTPNEWMKAQRLGEEYWLYIVEDAATDPKLYTIQNPATKLRPEEVAEVVRYVVKDWKKISEGGR
ncbi:MAG: DUF3883 domain-containing protein, partial [Candidatus Hadarchaeum sp.]